MAGNITKFKDLLVDTPTKYVIKDLTGANPQDKLIEFKPTTTYQQGTKDKAEYFNEMQKNGLYKVKATRVIEGVQELYDIEITGSETFDLFDTQFIIEFNQTNTKVNPLLRFNATTFPIRFLNDFNDIQVNIGDLKKSYIGYLDRTTSKFLVWDLYGSSEKIFYFDTIQDAQNASWLVVGDVVEVLGYYTKGDGGGHKRSKNPTGSTYEWKILSDEINIDFLGAKKNDVSFDNAPIINEALNGGNTLIPQGVYTTKTTIIHVNNRTLRGLGYTSMINPVFSTADNMLEITDSENFIVENIYFKGFDTPDSQYVNADLSSFGYIFGILTSGTLKNVHIRNCTFYGFNGITLKFTHTASCFKRLFLENCKIHNSAYGVQFALMCEYNKITGLEINNCNVAYEDNSGNNNLTNSMFNYNWIGFLMLDVGNGGHSIVSNITCNHNNNISFRFKNLKYGQVVNGVTAFYGKFILENCEGVNVVGSLFGTNELQIIGGGSINQFIGCTFDDTTTLFVDDISYPKFINCNNTRLEVGNGNSYILLPHTDIVVNNTQQNILTTVSDVVFSTVDGYYFCNNSTTSKARALSSDKKNIVLKGQNTVSFELELMVNSGSFSGTNVLDIVIYRNYHDINGNITATFEVKSLKEFFYSSNQDFKITNSFAHSDFAYSSAYGYSYSIKTASTFACTLKPSKVKIKALN